MSSRSRVTLKCDLADAGRLSELEGPLPGPVSAASSRRRRPRWAALQPASPTTTPPLSPCSDLRAIAAPSRRRGGARSSPHTREKAQGPAAWFVMVRACCFSAHNLLPRDGYRLKFVATTAPRSSLAFIDRGDVRASSGMGIMTLLFLTSPTVKPV